MKSMSCPVTKLPHRVKRLQRSKTLSGLLEGNGWHDRQLYLTLQMVACFILTLWVLCSSDFIKGFWAVIAVDLWPAAEAGGWCCGFVRHAALQEQWLKEKRAEELGFFFLCVCEQERISGSSCTPAKSRGQGRGGGNLCLQFRVKTESFYSFYVIALAELYRIWN